MKYVDAENLDRVPGRRLADGDTFCFRCHPQIACFNRCCRNLNLFLYPYDVLRLKNCLQIDSDAFIERHVDVVLREGHFFPEVLLRMAENDERTCPFLSAEGCDVYPHRPDTCRTFPVEQGALFDAATGRSTPVYYFRPPAFCLGPGEDQQWTVDAWTRDQEAERYHRMTLRWAEIRRLFQNDPWGAEGPEGGKARMAFMAAYNLDRFREFLFASTFFKRYRVKPDLKRKMRTSDPDLMLFGFEWIRFFVWGIPSKQIQVAKK
jgi:Fe-S-cluster containining protein